MLYYIKSVDQTGWRKHTKSFAHGLRAPAHRQGHATVNTVGVLTKNQLTVEKTWQLHSPHALAKTITQAINRTPHTFDDPLDAALAVFAGQKGVRQSLQLPLTRFSFDQSAAMSGNLWHSGERYALAIKGAPEHVFAHCDLTENEYEGVTTALHALAANGYHVVAVAHATFAKPITAFHELTPKNKLTLDGLVATSDVILPEAQKTIYSALNAGKIVGIITGNHLETAHYIARQLGIIKTRDQIFDTRRMSVMSDEELEEIIPTIRVFSHVTPKHQSRLFTLLEKQLGIVKGAVDVAAAINDSQHLPLVIFTPETTL